MRNFILTILFFCNLTTFGQDLKRVEQDLLIHLKKINYWADYSGNDNKISSSDSLEKENEIFKQKLLDYTTKQSLTITYDFIELQKEHLIIASSSDKKFRIYSWDTWLGGTMHDYENIYQYQADNKVFSKSLSYKRKEGDPGSWFSDIFTLDTNNRKFYIGYFHAIYSTSDNYQGIKLFEIKNNILNDTLHLIKTKTGIRNELGFNFNFFSVVDKKERPVKLIYYDSLKKTIKIPIIAENGKVTTKFINYQFTGQYFEKQIK